MPRFFSKAPDGGANSGVTGYFLVEIKWLFSVVLLHFAKGTREAFHEHAFNAVTLWLKGRVREHHLAGGFKEFSAGHVKYTPRKCFHKVEALESTWALSFRGPWVDLWRESRGGKLTTLTHGRREVCDACHCSVVDCPRYWQSSREFGLELVCERRIRGNCGDEAKG